MWTPVQLRKTREDSESRSTRGCCQPARLSGKVVDNCMEQVAGLTGTRNLDIIRGGVETLENDWKRAYAEFGEPCAEKGGGHIISCVVINSSVCKFFRQPFDLRLAGCGLFGRTGKDKERAGAPEFDS